MIGAGPKAVALAAKRRVLADRDYMVPELAVFDRSETCGNWSGKHGYTNGNLRLGTAPEKDVGFPYETEEFNPVENHDINMAMLRYSWLAYKVYDKQRSYADWIDRGRPMPQHRQWGRYLEWVADLVDMPVSQGELSEISLTDGRWRLRFDTGETVETDGLVITSPGPPKERIERRPAVKDAILNGKDFWEARGQMQVEELASGPSRACVIGSGETAAAIVVHLAGELRNATIEVVSRDGVIFTRGESYEENRLFSDHQGWEEFTPEVRRKFVSHTDRGVFSATCKATINECDFVRTIGGETEWIDAQDDQLYVGASERKLGPYDLVVDATGFRRDWFLEKMDEATLEALVAALPTIDPGTTEEGEAAPELQRVPTEEQLDLAIDRDLAVAGLKPLLHLPMFAAFAQGPGFPSLGCLGTLSDRILLSHMELNADEREHGD